jgi:hypothetical protein
MSEDDHFENPVERDWKDGSSFGSYAGPQNAPSVDRDASSVKGPSPDRRSVRSSELASDSEGEDEPVQGHGLLWHALDGELPRRRGLHGPLSEDKGGEPEFSHIPGTSAGPNDENPTFTSPGIHPLRLADMEAHSPDRAEINVVSDRGSANSQAAASDSSSYIDLEDLHARDDLETVPESDGEPGDEASPPRSSSARPAMRAAFDDASGSVNPLEEGEAATVGSDSGDRGRALGFKEATDRSKGKTLKASYFDHRRRADGTGGSDSGGRGRTRELDGAADARSKGKTLKASYYDHRHIANASRVPSPPGRNSAHPEEGESMPASPVSHASGELNPLEDAGPETSSMSEPHEREIRVRGGSPTTAAAEHPSMPIRPSRSIHVTEGTGMSPRLGPDHCFRRPLLLCRLTTGNQISYWRATIIPFTAAPV